MTMHTRFVACNELAKSSVSPDYLLSRFTAIFRCLEYCPRRRYIDVLELLRILDTPRLGMDKIILMFSQVAHPDAAISVAELCKMAPYLAELLRETASDPYKILEILCGASVQALMQPGEYTDAQGRRILTGIRPDAYWEQAQQLQRLNQLAPHMGFQETRVAELGDIAAQILRLSQRARAILPPKVPDTAELASLRTQVFTDLPGTFYYFREIVGLDEGIHHAFEFPDEPLSIGAAERIFNFYAMIQDFQMGPGSDRHRIKARSLFVLQRTGGVFRSLACFLSDFRFDNRRQEDLERFQFIYAEAVLKRISNFFRYPAAFAAFKQAARTRIQALVKAKINGASEAPQKFHCLVVGACTNEEAYTLALILAELVQEQFDRSKDLRRALNGRLTLGDWIQIDAVDDYSSFKNLFSDLVDNGSYPAFLSEEIPRDSLAFALRHGYMSQGKDHLQVNSVLRDLVTMHDVALLTPSSQASPAFQATYDLVSCNKVIEYLPDNADTPAKAQQAQTIIDLIDSGSLLALGGIYFTDGPVTRLARQSFNQITGNVLVGGEQLPKTTINIGRVNLGIFDCLMPEESKQPCVVYQKRTAARQHAMLRSVIKSPRGKRPKR